MLKGDIELGREVVTQGYLSPQQLATCLQIQQKKRASGQESSLKNVIIEQGLMSQEELQIIESDSAIQQEDQQKSIGKYTTVRELGRGGMGKVYLAKDNETQKEVALKVLLNQEDNSLLLRFLREAKANAVLKHPGIVQVLDTGQHQGQHFFTMEYIQGNSLQGYLQEKKVLSPQEALNFIIKIGKALHYAHQKGIVHRDIKPANIMLSSSKEPKVMDFGLAKVADASQKISLSGVLIGTLYYMSPEQADGSNDQVDQQTDVYALGVVLYEMLTGQLPFSGTGIGQVIQQILNQEPTPPSEINPKLPKSLDVICAQAMAKQKEHRYPNIPAFLQDIQLCLQGKAVTPKLAPKKNLGKLKAVAAAAIVLLLILLFFVLPSKPQQPTLFFQLVNEKHQPADTFQGKILLEVDTEDVLDLSKPFTLEVYGEGIRYTKTTIDNPEFPIRYPITLQDDRKTNFRLTSKISLAEASWAEEVSFHYRWPAPSLQIRNMSLKTNNDVRTYFYSNENIRLHFSWQAFRLKAEKVTAVLEGTNIETQTAELNVTAEKYSLPMIVSGSPSKVTATLTLKSDQKQATKEITFLLYKTQQAKSTDTENDSNEENASNEDNEKQDIKWLFDCFVTNAEGKQHKHFSLDEPTYFTLKCKDGHHENTKISIKLHGSGAKTIEQEMQFRKDHSVTIPIELVSALSKYSLHLEIQVDGEKFDIPVSFTKEVSNPFQATVRLYQNKKRLQKTVIYGQPVVLDLHWKNLKSNEKISLQSTEVFKKIQEILTPNKSKGKKRFILTWQDIVPDQAKIVFSIESSKQKVTKNFDLKIQKPKPKIKSIRYSFADLRSKKKIPVIARWQLIGLKLQWDMLPKKHGHKGNLEISGQYLPEAIKQEILPNTPRDLFFPLDLEKIHATNTRENVKIKINFKVGPTTESRNISIKHTKNFIYYFHKEKGFGFIHPKSFLPSEKQENFVSVAIHPKPQHLFIADLIKPDGDGFRTFVTALMIPLKEGVDSIVYYKSKIQQESKNFKKLMSKATKIGGRNSNLLVYHFTQSRMGQGTSTKYKVRVSNKSGSFGRKSYSGPVEKTMAGAYWLVPHKGSLLALHLQSQKEEYPTYVKMLNDIWKEAYLLD